MIFDKKICKAILCVIIISICIYILYLLVWVFVYDTFPVNTYSMYPTIKPGDRVIVNKLIFGARLYTNLDFDSKKDLKLMRMTGYREIEHNDIVVFNSRSDENWYKTEFKINSIYIKRCIGLPGDSVLIKNGSYLNRSFSKNLMISKVNEADLRNLDPSVIQTYPYDSLILWTIKDFGPLYIPRKGDKVTLSRDNVVIYKKYIEYETSRELWHVNGNSYLNGVKIKDYSFKTNYYFMAGDNAVDSRDSRYFGLVPEEFIVGVVPYIVYSKQPHSDKIRWDRIFKRL